MYLPNEWIYFLKNYLNIEEHNCNLLKFIKEYDFIIPEKEKIYSVFHSVNPSDVKCVLFGEDPYPRITSACGVAFWDKEINSWHDKTNGNSLKNILKALLTAKGITKYSDSINKCREAAHKCHFISPPQLFELWLKQGVLLVNTALTFSGNSDKKKHMEFWRGFHRSLIESLNKRHSSPFYILWGKKAQTWEAVILNTIDDKNKIIKQGHPAFIHQFMNKNDETHSPFYEIINKTGLTWY
jgi:uracil DNA glycosylase